jgi:hypothetical protein
VNEKDVATRTTVRNRSHISAPHIAPSAPHVRHHHRPSRHYLHSTRNYPPTLTPSAAGKVHTPHNTSPPARHHPSLPPPRIATTTHHHHHRATTTATSPPRTGFVTDPPPPHHEPPKTTPTEHQNITQTANRLHQKRNLRSDPQRKTTKFGGGGESRTKAKNTEEQRVLNKRRS